MEAFFRFGGTWLTIIFHLGRSQLAGGPSENYFKILVKRKGTRIEIQIQNTEYTDTNTDTDTVTDTGTGTSTRTCAATLFLALPFATLCYTIPKTRGSEEVGAKRKQIGPGI